MHEYLLRCSFISRRVEGRETEVLAERLKQKHEEMEKYGVNMYNQL
jgi:hypothetical protein